MKYIVLILSSLMLSATGCAKKPTDQPPMKITINHPKTLEDDFVTRTSAWRIHDGEWVFQNGMLIQTATSRYYPLILNTTRQFATVDASVRFQPRSGRIDASGGLVFRAQDGENYYLVRANALEDNFRLYTFKNGNRSQIASATVTPPTTGKWHTLRVTALGDHIQAWLDGALALDHHDNTFANGYTGLWTKADSVTAFDAFTVRGE